MMKKSLLLLGALALSTACDSKGGASSGDVCDHMKTLIDKAGKEDKPDDLKRCNKFMAKAQELAPKSFPKLASCVMAASDLKTSLNCNKKAGKEMAEEMAAAAAAAVAAGKKP
jgi:hypothetical protein